MLYCRVEDKLSVCIKTKTHSFILKKKLNFAFTFEHAWFDLVFLNILLPLKFYSITLERQAIYLKCFLTMPLWQSNDLSTMFCHQNFLVQCLLSIFLNLLPFIESIWLFSVNLKPWSAWWVYSIQKLRQEYLPLFSLPLRWLAWLM